MRKKEKVVGKSFIRENVEVFLAYSCHRKTRNNKKKKKNQNQSDRFLTYSSRIVVFSKIQLNVLTNCIKR